MNRDVTALVVQAQQGDRAAFSCLVRHFQHMAVGYAYSILGDFHLAEDAAQEAFVQAYLDLPKLREAQAFSAWLRRMVFKYCDRQYRGKRLWTETLEDARHVASQEAGPLQQTIRQELSEKIMRTIQALPEAQRAVTTLCYIDGYSQAEVGEFLEIPVSTVKSRLHQARKNLQQTMSDMIETSVKQHATGTEFARKVEEILDGVENIEWKKGCNCFSGSVVACMQFLKEEISYHFVTAVSGAAFHIQWAWEPDNCAPEVTLGEELARRTFRALGYECTQVTDFEKVSPENSEAAWRQRIIANIDKGSPIIARGVVGPPECCVIAGYAQGGEVLLGRSYFYPDSKGYFRKGDWYKECFGLIEIGNKIGAPARTNILRQTLEWALELAQTPEMNGRATGFAAYETWADALERDEDFPEDDLEILSLRCMATVNDGFGYLADLRWSAGEFLNSIADECGEAAAELKAAADACKAESKLHCRGMKFGSTSFAPDEEKRRIADPALRREMARLVREAGVKYRAAFGHIKQALERMP